MNARGLLSLVVELAKRDGRLPSWWASDSGWAAWLPLGWAWAEMPSPALAA